MSKARGKQSIDKHLMPPAAGHSAIKPTLCIGLDIAWFGGQEKVENSQYDFLVAALIAPKSTKFQIEQRRVRLVDRDPKAELICEAVKELLKSFDNYERIVFAVDAPLQSAERKELSTRKSVPTKGSVKRRACDEYLSCKRKAIDKAAGGASGWHPNIQPGAPLAPRIEHFIQGLPKELRLWTPSNSGHKKLAIECFPAEAIWAAKRMNWFPASVKATGAKNYKKQKGISLTASQVTKFVKTTLDPFANACPKGLCNKMVEYVLAEILADEEWKKNRRYPGGKMLDDVVDSMLCLATAISYATTNAHVWHDANHPTDGHIIGPGNMLKSLTGKTRLQ